MLLSIVLVFCILGTIVYTVSRRITREMSASAIQNVSESLDLLQCTIEAILRNEVEFQALIAQEIAAAEDPEAYIRTHEKNRTMSKMSLILSGETEGVSNTGDSFTEEGLDFSRGGTVEGLPVSQSYLNYMGLWAYTIKCPVERDGRELGTLYAEYVYDAIDEALPNGFYNSQASLYIMDAGSERFVLKPKGMGQRSAGHLNLADFYRANNIRDPDIQAEVRECLEGGRDILFYHSVREVQALNYMWAVNGGTIFLVGYVPVSAIQQEGRAVNQNIFIVVVSMLVAFFLCILLYYLSWRQQDKLRREREEERKLLNRQLAEALRAAQIASESKTTFLSNMSHDIRTPMNAIVGMTAIATANIDDKQQVQNCLKKIALSSKHLLGLINDVLDMSKIESGKMTLSMDQVSLREVMDGIVSIAQPQVRAKHQQFDVSIHDISAENVCCDSVRLNQVLLNILGNAIKFTPDGGNINVAMFEEPSGRGENFVRIHFRITDNGIGMTEEFRAHIFESFVREDNTRVRKTEGSGLGMAITKYIIDAMGGIIEVDSKLGEGTSFHVALDLEKAGVLEADMMLPNWNMLVVDDDKQLCESTAASLRSIGVQADWTLDAESALDMVGESYRKNDPYHIILLDWKLPGMDGLAAARELRKRYGDDIPILLISAYDWGEIEDEAKASGVTGFIPKPLFKSTLYYGLKPFAAPDGGEAKDEPEPVNAASDLSGCRVLLAGDNDLNWEIAEELLSAEGLELEWAENGQICVDKFQAAAAGYYDAILMDLRMPVMTGYEATRAIRNLERPDAKKIPIIAMTADAFAEDIQKCLEAGMNAHVAKPIDVREVCRLLAKFLKPSP